MGVYKVETASRLCGKADQQSRKNVENFLKNDQPSAGQLHRYSFDMRA